MLIQLAEASWRADSGSLTTDLFPRCEGCGYQGLSRVPGLGHLGMRIQWAPGPFRKMFIRSSGTASVDQYRAQMFIGARLVCKSWLRGL